MDIFTSRVKNMLLLPLMICAVWYRVTEAGPMEIVNGLCDMFLISCFLLPVFAFRALGAADIKLFLVFAMMAGFQDAVIVICGSVVIGAVAALIKMIYLKIL